MGNAGGFAESRLVSLSLLLHRREPPGLAPAPLLRIQTPNFDGTAVCPSCANWADKSTAKLKGQLQPPSSRDEVLPLPQDARILTWHGDPDLVRDLSAIYGSLEAIHHAVASYEV